MNIEDIYKLCEEIAIEAHGNQPREGGGLYIEHPKRVANKCLDNLLLKCISILHDVIEDTSFSADILLSRGVPKIIVEKVLILTKRKGESYLKFILRILEDRDASIVKYLDICDNLSDSKPGSRKDKYELAKYIIQMVHGPSILPYSS